MPTEQDWRQSDAARRLREQADNERIRRQGEARHHALQAQTVLDHPGWQWFARQIDEYKGRIDQFILQAQERVTHKNLTAQEEAWLKLDCRKAIGEAAALTTVLQMVREAVEKGRQSIEVAGNL